MSYFFNLHSLTNVICSCVYEWNNNQQLNTCTKFEFELQKEVTPQRSCRPLGECTM